MTGESYKYSYLLSTGCKVVINQYKSVCIAIHKPTPLRVRPRVSGFVNCRQTSILVYHYHIIVM